MVRWRIASLEHSPTTAPVEAVDDLVLLATPTLSAENAKASDTSPRRALRARSRCEERGASCLGPDPVVSHLSGVALPQGQRRANVYCAPAGCKRDALSVRRPALDALSGNTFGGHSGWTRRSSTRSRTATTAAVPRRWPGRTRPPRRTERWGSPVRAAWGVPSPISGPVAGWAPCSPPSTGPPRLRCWSGGRGPAPASGRRPFSTTPAAGELTHAL